ncbi:MAG: M14 family metallopeptidase [Bacteroides sp.]
MKKEILFRMESPFRDTFQIISYRFGSGHKSLAIVGQMRGDEVHQLYVCSQLVNRLKQLEQEGKLLPDHEILVIPSANPFSMNIGKRFWAMDNTDINRMFPGYDKGETTQRIAAALFGELQGYDYGVQMASFYIPGDFIPHVRIIRTGYEDVETASLFGLPYISLRQPLPFDTTLLNYNWQIWETKAFSIYGGQNKEVEGKTTTQIVQATLRFMQRIGALKRFPVGVADFRSEVMDAADLLSIKTPCAGILYRLKGAGSEVQEGELIARIIDPYEGHVTAEITAPRQGLIFYAANQPLTLQHTTLFKMI